MGDIEAKRPLHRVEQEERESAASIRAMSRGTTLGGLKIKDLIDEGRR
jgi:hypothetical protein